MKLHNLKTNGASAETWGMCGGRIINVRHGLIPGHVGSHGVLQVAWYVHAEISPLLYWWCGLEKLSREMGMRDYFNQLYWFCVLIPTFRNVTRKQSFSSCIRFRFQFNSIDLNAFHPGSPITGRISALIGVSLEVELEGRGYKYLYNQL